jgi:rare lipoprotein A
MRKLLLVTVFLLAGCTEVQVASHLWKKAAVGAGPACRFGQEGVLKVGSPYSSRGVRYVPIASSAGFREEGIASWYGADFHGRTTANGECYDMYAMTAAHPTLPLPTMVKVTNLENGRTVVLRVNDRGPFVKGRVIDLSFAAARKLAMSKQGVAPVRVEAIGGPHHGPERGMTTRVVRRQPPARPVARKAAHIPKNPPAKARFTERVTADAKPLPPRQQAKMTTAHKVVQQAKAPLADDPEELMTDLSPPPGKAPETSDAKLKITRLFIQTGAFGSRTNAERQRNLVAELAQSTLISRYQQPGGSLLHRVRVGPFDNIAAADAVLAKLVQAGFNTAVIAVEN